MEMWRRIMPRLYCCMFVFWGKSPDFVGGNTEKVPILMCENMEKVPILVGKNTEKVPILLFIWIIFYIFAMW